MRFVTSICYGSVTPLLSTNQKKKEKRKEKGRLCHWNGEKKKKKENLYIGSLRIFLLGQIAIDNNSKYIWLINHPICKSHLKLEIVKINFQKKQTGFHL
jgi:hypothetical protein